MDFRIIGGNNGRNAKIPFERERKYFIPDDATHTHVYANELCFGYSVRDIEVLVYKPVKGGRINKIKKILPGGIPAKFVSFPKQNDNEYYPEPEFHP